MLFFIQKEGIFLFQDLQEPVHFNRLVKLLHNPYTEFSPFELDAFTATLGLGALAAPEPPATFGGFMMNEYQDMDSCTKHVDIAFVIDGSGMSIS